MREKMLEDPRFTRLGWGSGDEANSDDGTEDGVIPDEQTEVRTVENHERAAAEPVVGEAIPSAVNGDAEVDEPSAIEVVDPTPSADQPADPAGPIVSRPDDPAEPIPVGDTQEAPLVDAPTRPDESDPEVSVQDSHGDASGAGPREVIDQTTSVERVSTPYTDLVTELDTSWDPTEGGFPPGRLPDSAKDLESDVIESMNPGVRRVLEYQGAAEYIAENVADHPWLKPVLDASPAVQRIFTAIDQGVGHGHIRHGPMGADKLYADRVAYLEDPAQTDPEQRARSIDAFIPNVVHYCAQESTRIGDAEAFVAAFAGALKHPEVRGTLDSPWVSKNVPDKIAIPISELLGPDGHESCSGYRLAGEWSESKKIRKQWVKARAEGQDVSGMPQPKAERISTFEGGDIVVSFSNNSVERRYEIISLYPRARSQEVPES